MHTIIRLAAAAVFATAAILATSLNAPPAYATMTKTQIPAQHVSGRITKIAGDLITIRSGRKSIIIQSATARTNRMVDVTLKVGAMIKAYGNWNGNLFIAQSIR